MPAVFSRLNPAGLKITSFKVPGETELAHDYMWRIMQAMPERGSIGIFNRSHYEDVLVVQVKEMNKGYHMADRVICQSTEDFFEKRYRHFRNYEEYLYENSYRMIKIFLNISKEKQKERLPRLLFKCLGNFLFTMTDAHLYAKLLMDMLGQVLSTIDRAVLSARTAKTEHQRRKATLDIAAHMGIS